MSVRDADKRPRALSSDEAGLQNKQPRTEGSNGKRHPNHQAGVSDLLSDMSICLTRPKKLIFNTNDISGSATIYNAGGHIIHGDYIVQQINRDKGTLTIN